MDLQKQNIERINIKPINDGPIDLFQTEKTQKIPLELCLSIKEGQMIF